jgi:hypothetical protein
MHAIERLLRIRRASSAGVAQFNAHGANFVIVRRRASMLRLASPNDKNQCAFRHSLPNRPLKDSTLALSVGLPGGEKSSPMPFS